MILVVEVLVGSIFFLGVPSFLHCGGACTRFLVYFFWSCWTKADGGYAAGVGFNCWGGCLE